MAGSSFAEAWSALDRPFVRCLELAYESLAFGGLAVGSVISGADLEIIAVGRNRAYDPPGGADVLQGSPIADAEMNALAAVPTNLDLSACVLWSTQQPCSMCAAAIEFTEVGATKFLAPDPSAGPGEAAGATAGGADHWIVAANLLFLHNPIVLYGPRTTMVESNRTVEPEVTDLAVELVAERAIADRVAVGADVAALLEDLWPAVTDAAARRDQRRRR